MPQLENEQQNYSSTNEEQAESQQHRYGSTNGANTERKQLSPSFAVENFAPTSTTAGTEPSVAGTLIPAEEEELRPLLSRGRGSFLSQEVTVPAEASWSVLAFLASIFEFCYHKNPKSSAIVLVLLILIFILFYTTFKQLDVLILQSVLPDLQSISVLDVNEDGVNLHVIASIFVNYDSITNLAYKYLVKVSALFVGVVTFVPNDSIKIFISLSSSPEAYDHIIDIFPPEININTVDKSLSEIDFISKTDFAEENVIKVVNYIKDLSKTQESISLKILSTIDGSVKSHFFNVGTNGIDFSFNYNLETKRLKPDVEIKDFSIQNSNSTSGYDLSTSFDLKLDMPLKFDVNPIEWDVLFKDCNQQQVNVGSNWFTNEIISEPNEPLRVQFGGIVEEIPERLTLECTTTKHSIINQIVQRFLQEGKIAVTVEGRKSKINKDNLPAWLYSILSNIKSEIDITIPNLDPNYFFNDYPSTLQLRDLSIDIPSVCDELPCVLRKSENLYTTVEGNVTIIVKVPNHPLDVDIGDSKFRGNILIKDKQGSGLVEITSSNTYNKVAINKTFRKEKEIVEIDFELKGLEINYLQPTEIGYILNSTINEREGLLSSLLIDGFLEELNINLPILKTKLKNLTFMNLSITNPPKIKDKIETQKYLDDLISGVEVNVTNIYYISSTSTELNLMADVDVNNPTNISINIPQDTLGMDISSNGTYIANFTTTDLFIPKQKDQDTFSLTVGLNLKPHGLVDKLALERLVSEFVSGYSGMKFEIDGNRHSLKYNQEVNDIINQIGISSIQLPPVLFNSPAEDDSEENEIKIDEENGDEPRRSPFLVDSTIHILSSEIELTIFNPVSNAELMAQIDQAQATYKGELLGQLAHSEVLMIPPGLYTTPRIPVKISSGIGMDILRKAINGQLDVEVIAVFGLRLDKFDLQLFYEGAGLKSNIKF